MNAHYAGIDIGGTSVKWIIATDTGHIIDEGRIGSNKTAIIDQVARLSATLKDNHPHLQAIGAVTPGLVDTDTGTVIYASNLALNNAPLARAIEKASGLPAVIGHDGRSAGLAEGILGAAKGAKSYIMIPIGTGISAAIHTGEHLIAGAQYSAGEIGHIPAIPGGDPCSCGQRGCLEVYASAKGIARQYAQATGIDIGTRAIEKRLGTDPEADRVWDQAITTMATALTQLTFTIDPERILIGGGLSKAGSTYIDPLTRTVQSMMAWRKSPQIVTAALGDMAGLWGALILASQRLGRTDYTEWITE